jgi:hypothetical protein
MSELRLSGAEPAAIVIRHIPRNGTEPLAITERWYIVADYGSAETVVATCDHPHHARAVASALAIVHAVPLSGDLGDLALSS